MTFTLTDEEKARIIMSGALSENRLRIVEAIIQWAVAADRVYLEGGVLYFNVTTTETEETDKQNASRLAEDAAWEELQDMGIVGPKTGGEDAL